MQKWYNIRFINPFTTIHDENFRRHSSCYVTIQDENFVAFTLVTPGSLDPGMHFGLEVKWLIEYVFSKILSAVVDGNRSRRPLQGLSTILVNLNYIIQ